MTNALQHLKGVFNRLNAGNLDLLEEIYDPQVYFRDPVHELRGLGELRAYYARLYENVLSCRFDYEAEVINGDQAVLLWVMHLRHATLEKGRTLDLRGASHLKFADRVHYHHDYFDMGAFIYERVPLLGAVVRAVKARL